MEIKHNDYVLGFWTGHSEEFRADFLMTVLRRDGEWHGEYRFRYHRDEKVYGSADEKSFYNFKSRVDERDPDGEALLANLERVLIPAIRVKYPDVRFNEVKGDGQRFMYVMALNEQSHIKRVNAEEWEKMQGGEA